MKAVVYKGPSQVELEDIPIPKITSSEYLLKVTYCGLCKTDIKKILGVTLSTKGVLEPPRVFGHEIVGEIAKVGNHITDWKVGDRIAVFHHVPCLNCYYCLNGDYAQCGVYREVDTSSGVGKPSGGGFGEYVKVPTLVAKYGTVKIPEEVSYEQASFIEPTNCCLKGIKKASIQLGDSVAVFGQGPIGLTLTQLAHKSGAYVVAVDLVDYRLAYSITFNADLTVNATKKHFIDEIKNVTDGRGVDKSIVAVEDPRAVEQAIQCTRGGGEVVFFAEFGEEKYNCRLNRFIDNIYGKEINVHGCYSSSYPDHNLSAEMVFEEQIKTKEMITHVFKLEKLMEAVELANKRRHITWEGEILSNKPRESLKILIGVA